LAPHGTRPLEKKDRPPPLLRRAKAPRRGERAGGVTKTVPQRCEALEVWCLQRKPKEGGAKRHQPVAEQSTWETDGARLAISCRGAHVKLSARACTVTTRQGANDDKAQVNSLCVGWGPAKRKGSTSEKREEKKRKKKPFMQLARGSARALEHRKNGCAERGRKGSSSWWWT